MLSYGHTLQPFCPPHSCQPVPQPFQANPLSPQICQAVHTAQSFVVLGDVGDRGPAQYHLAQRLTQEFAEEPFGCLLLLGDNVYDIGEPEHFEASLGEPYRYFRERGVPVYAVLGNHDVQTAHGILQLQYWGGLPRYYQVTLAQGAVTVIALDTTLLCPGIYECYATPAACSWAQQQATHQLAWLAQTLRTRRAPLTIVVGHYPLYSSGPHGRETDIQARLRQTLEPLLTDPTYSVQLYLAGHEHLFEVTPPICQGQVCPPDQGGVIHMISGAAGRLSQVELPDSPHPRWAAVAQHHYVRCAWVAESRCLTYTVKAWHGAVIGTGTIPARGASCSPSWRASIPSTATINMSRNGSGIPAHP